MRLRGLALLAILAPAMLAGCRPPAAEAPTPYAAALLRAPDGRCGARLAVRPGAIVILDGGQSGVAGKGSGELSYRWRQTAGPEVSLNRPNLSSVEVSLRVPGAYRFELRTRLGAAESLPSEVEIDVRADAPALEAIAGPDPAARGAGFALYQADLGELVRVFGAKTGITLRVDPAWLRPEDFRDRPVSLMARSVSPEVALELAARLAGGVFVCDGPDSATLTAGCGWLAAERQDARLHPAGGLGPAEDGGQILELARASCRAALFACPNASVEWRAEAAGIQAVGPESMHRRIRELLAAAGAAEARAPQPAPPDGDARLRQAVLGRRISVTLVAAELSEAALELERLLGVPVAWEEPPGRARPKLPRVSLSARDQPAAEVLAELARQGGLGGHSWVRGGGVWLWRSAPREGSAESLWTAAVVRAYPLGWMEDKNILPGMVVLAVKKRVRPESWHEPAALCAWHRDSKKLVVINSPDVQAEVVRTLHDLVRQAEKKPAGD